MVVAIYVRWGAVILIMVGIGFFLGQRHGKRTEAKAWAEEVLPAIKRLETERNTLWRSAVSKTQRLNRIGRLLRGHE